jgi:hypothetical protein
MMAIIGDLARSINVWNKKLGRLGEFVEGGDPAVAEKREVEKATKTIDNVNKLHDEVAKHRTNTDQRFIGFVLHAEPIVVADGPTQLTRDWLYRALL